MFVLYLKWVRSFSNSSYFNSSVIIIIFCKIFRLLVYGLRFIVSVFQWYYCKQFTSLFAQWLPLELAQSILLDFELISFDKFKQKGTDIGYFQSYLFSVHCCSLYHLLISLIQLCSLLANTCIRPPTNFQMHVFQSISFDILASKYLSLSFKFKIALLFLNEF